MTAKQKHYEILANTVIKNLEKRHMEGYYCKSKEEALEKALSFVEDEAMVSWGGSQSIVEIGLVDALKAGNYDVIDRSTAKSDEEALDLQRKVFASDTYFLSCNAITRDGIIYNVDGVGNRVAAMIYGPKQVIIIAGMNKICLNDEEANDRVRNTAAPINAQRLHKDTPCAAHGQCGDCLRDDTICSHTVITRNSKPVGRIKVILVEETLGY